MLQYFKVAVLADNTYQSTAWCFRKKKKASLDSEKVVDFCHVKLYTYVDLR